MFTLPCAAQQSSSEIYQKEMEQMLSDNPYDSLLDDESRALYQKMHRQMEEYEVKAEEGKTDWVFILAVCAVPLVVFLGRFFYYYLKDGNKPSLRELLYVVGFVVFIALVLYLLHTTSFYLRFYADEKLRTAAVIAIVIIGAIVLWIRSTKKNDSE